MRLLLLANLNHIKSTGVSAAVWVYERSAVIK
jgi:hypothetical protein